MADTVIFLTSRSSWNKPADWNPSANTIEAIGGGGDGGTSGPGGGAYAKIVNWNGAATVSYQIGAHGGTTGSGTSPTSNTWFDSGSVLVAAGGVSNASGAPGGTTANSVGSTKFAGGNCATVGGGGAAGPDGAGLDSSGTGDGGAGDNGNPAGGAGGVFPGGSGGDGTSWTSNPGGASAGAGGGGAANSGPGGNGGNYGAGGSFSSVSGGVGRNGIIVITYTPLSVPTGWQSSGGDKRRPVAARAALFFGYALPFFIPAQTPSILASAGGDPLPRPRFVPVSLRTAYGIPPFAFQVAATPAALATAGGDPLPRARFVPISLRTSYARPEGLPPPPPPNPTPSDFPAALGFDQLPRSRYVPPALRTSYGQPPFSFPIAATPSIYGWQGTSFSQDAVFQKTKLAKIQSATRFQPGWSIAPPRGIIAGRKRIPLFLFVPPAQLADIFNILINETNANAVIYGLQNSDLIPLRIEVDQDKFLDELNILVKDINDLLVLMTAPKDYIRQFIGAIPPSETTQAMNDLIGDINAGLTLAFGA